MECREKNNLQHQCTEALQAYQLAIKDLELPLDPLTGAILLRSSQERRILESPIDPQTGFVKQSYLDAMALHRAYHKASATLSKHLSTHRC